ncbi:MAG TPA: hypothetical protein PKW95_02220 [bacterium]|mgnify:CR=1 FL=1|nr:hypothetical protein [bacterium]
MEKVVLHRRVKKTMGIQTIIYLVLAAFFSLPSWSEWLQDKLNLVSTYLLDSNAAFAEHSLFQAGAFVLMIFLAYLSGQIFFGIERFHGMLMTLIGLDIAYALAGLFFFIFSKTQMLHDLFVFVVFGTLGVWAAVAYFKPLPEPPSAGNRR